MVTDILSIRYVLLSTLNARLLSFEHLKELYAIDLDFATVYFACQIDAFDKFYRPDGFLFCEGKLHIPNFYIREHLVHKSHGGGLMGHFGIGKTLDV